MSGNPLISILTPVYNQEKYIGQTIRSVLNQTYQNWEWIILDDGSTDGTADIIGRFKESRIRYSFQEHAGIANLTKTYNTARAMCNGDFIAMLDHDDYWPDYKLEVQIKSFADPDVVLSYGECRIVNQKGKAISYKEIPKDREIAFNDPVGSSLKGLLLERYSFIANPTVMLRREAILNIGGFVDYPKLFHDFPTWGRLSLEGRFAAVPLCLGFHRKHPSSITFNSDPESRFGLRLKFIREFLAENRRKLAELGFHYDSDVLERQWEEVQKRQIYPYNMAMLLLKLGLFKEAEAEFSKFEDRNPSLKNSFIHFLINLSSAVKIDLVNPSAELKSGIEAFFRRKR